MSAQGFAGLPYSSQPTIRTLFVCSGCGGQFFDRHSCPHMPWQLTALTTGFLQIPRLT